MCFFFKKKPKFTKAQADEIMANVLTSHKIPGFPFGEERNDENFQLVYKPDSAFCTVDVKGTVDGFTTRISPCYSFENQYLSFYVVFENISFQNRFDEKKELNKRYPLYKFDYLEKSTWADKLQNVEGQKIRYCVKCKTLEQISNGVEKFIEDFAYENVYQSVIEVNKGQRLGD